MITRRTFLKGLASAVIIAATPATLVNESEKFLSSPVKKSTHIDGDFIISTGGDIRYVGNNSNQHTVLEFHRWLQNMAEEPAMTENHKLDITSPNPSLRFTDNIIELNSPYNIDDYTARYLKDGSLFQDDRETIFTANIGYGFGES